jgi:hypothetical protein
MSGLTKFGLFSFFKREVECEFANVPDPLSCKIELCLTSGIFFLKRFSQDKLASVKTI